MSILDTFYILYKEEGAEDLQKSQQEIEKSSDKLDKTTGKLNPKINETDKYFTKLDKTVSGLIKNFLGLAAAYFSVNSIASGFESALDYSTQLDRTSRSLGVNVSDLDAWSNAVMRVGGSAEGFKSTLENLTQNLNITGDTALKILPQLADTFQKLGPITSARYGKSLGLDESTILLLQQGREAVDALVERQKSLGLITEKDAKSARELNYAWQDAGHALRIAFIELGEAVLPILIKIVDGFSQFVEFLRSHGTFIRGILIAIGVAVGALATVFIGLNLPIIALVTLIGGLITAFGLLYEDIKYFVAGNDSAIGHLLEKWPKVGQVIKEVFEDIKATIEDVVEAYDKVKNFLNKPIKVTDLINNDVTPNTTDQATKILNSGNNIQDLLQKGQELIASFNLNPLLSQTPGSIGNNALANTFNDNAKGNTNYSFSTGAITIETQATDANGIADTLQRTLEDHFRQVNNTFDNGIAR